MGSVVVDASVLVAAVLDTGSPGDRARWKTFRPSIAARIRPASRGLNGQSVSDPTPRSAAMPARAGWGTMRRAPETPCLLT